MSTSQAPIIHFDKQELAEHRGVSFWIIRVHHHDKTWGAFNDKSEPMFFFEHPDRDTVIGKAHKVIDAYLYAVTGK